MSEREEGLATVGARLRRWRLEQPDDLSQVAAAEQIKAAQSSWAAWERGEKGPDLHFAFEIERLTGGAVLASDWAFPRKGSKASADESGEHSAVDAEPRKSSA